MSKRTKSSPVPTPTYNGRPLVVWGVRRKQPDWDTFIAALLAFSLRKVEEEDASKECDDD